MTRTPIILVPLVLAASALAIAGHLLANPWLIYIFKPLATILIFFLAFTNWTKSKLPFAFWICIGLIFSLLGDILLIRPDHLFVAGLAAFLLAHLAYLTAFTRDAKFPANWLLWLAFLAVAATNFFGLRPTLPAGLALPVAVYAVALSTMTAQATGRAFLLRTSSAKLAAAGALFFLISDTLLAWNRFHHPIPQASLLILAPYYAAQLLFAVSTKSSS